MTHEVVIFGCGEFARSAKVYLEHDSPYRVAAFCVDRARRTSPTLLGLDVVAYEDLPQRFPPDRARMLVAIGYTHVNRAREAVYRRVTADGYRCITYVGSQVVRTGDVRVGVNSVVFDGSIIQPFATIGDDVVVWNGANIGHDTTVGDHCFIAPEAAIAGNVTIHSHCFVGVNATIRDGVTIAPSCVIGAGALILHDTVENGVYIGTETHAATVSSDRLKKI